MPNINLKKYHYKSIY